MNGGSPIGSSALDTTGVATLVPNLPAGTYSITAVYSGDGLHSPSTSAAATISTLPATFNLTVNPPTINLITGQHQTVNVSIASVNNGVDTVNLGCNNLPAAVNCHFSNASVNLVAGATSTVQLTIDTNNPLGGGATVSRNATSSPHPANTALAGLFLPIAAFFGLLLWRARRRSFRLLSLGLLAALSFGALALSGCGGFSQSTATPGSYVIQVTGVGTQSNQTHYVNLTLNITK
uniref:Bacterial Ig-like domain-containing protein n=1 Tax=mine drainage metagenome TaxID=410659 RepID=E6QLM6_9ZZZZ